jgi:hypothetical protein
MGAEDGIKFGPWRSPNRGYEKLICWSLKSFRLFLVKQVMATQVLDLPVGDSKFSSGPSSISP